MSARLGYLLKKFPRLSETFVLNEILGQEGLGRSVRVFSRRTADDEPRHPQLRRLEAPVEVLPPIRELDPWPSLFRRGRARTRRLSAVGGLVREAARDWSHPRFPSLLAEALHLVPRLRSAGVAHLHVHFATDSALVAYLVRRLGGPTYSLTAHAKDIYRSAVDPVLFDRLFSGSSFAVTVCDANVRHLQDRLSGQALRRLRRLYNGIDLSDFRETADASGRESNHVLAVGRLVEKKGFDVLLRALAILRSAGRRVSATLVGDGDQRPTLERLCGELELDSEVRFTGALGQAEVRSFMARATVFCLPCRVGTDGNRDALPTVLLESLACGLPAISTPVVGVPEILDGGRVGLLVAEDSPEETAEALACALDRPSWRREVGEAGRLRVERLFDLRQSARTLGSWFDAVASSGGRMQCAS